MKEKRMSTELINYFKYKYQEGYYRFFDKGKCYYVPKQQFIELLLEDLK